MNEERIFSKLDQMEVHGRETLAAVTRLEEQIKEVPDLRNRVRALEQWRWMVVGALAAGGGSISAQIFSAFKGGA